MAWQEEGESEAGNSPASMWHQGVLYFHPSLGEKLMKLWCFPFQNLPETLEQVQGKKQQNPTNKTSNQMV